MGKNVKFTDNSKEIKDLLCRGAIAGLHEAAGELVAATEGNMKTISDTGQTKNAWSYAVDEDKLTATIGNPLENAIWTEYGTGEFSLNGKGRKGAWYVAVDGYTGKKAPTFNGKVVIVHGKDGKKFYKTNGKKPQRPFFKAFTAKKNIIPKIIANRMKEFMK